MVFRKRVSIMLASSAISIMALVGCSSTNEEKVSTTSDADPLEVLANKNARAALAMSIDKQQMCDLILNNGTTPADYFVAKGLSVNSDQVDYRDFAGDMGYKFDTTKAEEYWKLAKDEVGFDTVTMELLMYDDETSKKQAEFIQAQLQDSLDGLIIKIKQQPFKQKMELDKKGDFHLSASSWVPDFPDPLTFLENMESNKSYAKNTSYSDKEYDALINEAKVSANQDDSWNKYASAEKQMLEDGYILPLTQANSSYLEKGYVKGRILYTYGAPVSYKNVMLGEGRKELNITTSSDIPTIDPSRCGDSASSEVLKNTMEGLVWIDDKGEVKPGVAETWEKSEDGKTWTFKLRKNAKWSNGDPVTAKDFEFGWKRSLDPNISLGNSFVMYDIVGAEDYNLGKVKNADEVGIRAVDDYTLKVELHRPVHYFDSLIFLPIFLPQNQKVVEQFGDEYGMTEKNMVYNGPFTLSEWKMEDKYVLAKNDTYWDKGSIKIDKVNTKIVKDNNAALNLYEAGEIDVVKLTSDNVDKYKDSPEFKVNKQATTSFLQVNGGKFKSN